ncbi:NADH dehydrogenase subunit D [Tanacetum coccineum]
MWGGKKRLYSATKFILYTAGGSIFLLMGVLGIGLYGSNEPTLNFETSVNQSYPVALEIIFYIGFFIAFAVKLPILPLHTWLPDTHGEAHYSTCMLLAGILLKMGAYGLIRINMELLPHAHSIFSPWLMIVGIASITDTGLNGAILQIISHGFIGAALFFLAGTSYDRIRLVYLDEMGGVAIPMPKIFTMFSSFSMASLALPGIGMYPDFVLSLSVDKTRCSKALGKNVAKDLWEKIKLLMQRTSLTKQERKCKLYDEFDKFTYKKGETLHEYYLRFTLLLNDMNIYKMPLEQFQVNTKFLNTLPDEWSKFVTDVKLVKDLHTTNVDQLHAYLQQHERHANEVRLMHERNSDPLSLVASHQLTQPAYQSHLHTHPKSLSQLHVSPYQSSQFVTPYQTQQFRTNQSTPLTITHPTNEYQSTVYHNVYSPQPSIPQLEYASSAYQQQQPEFSQPDSSLVVLVF